MYYKYLLYICILTSNIYCIAIIFYMKSRIAIFASGTGTNALNITRYFRDSTDVSVALICSNNPNAPILKSIEAFGVDTYTFDRSTFYHSSGVVNHLQSLRIDVIVLAGFLWLIPENLIKVYPGKIINIHPSLLPKYGGKGMYGNHVHRAVLEANEPQSGITIHLVDEVYDRGEILFQARCGISREENIDSLKEKIHELEYKHFPMVIESFIVNHLSQKKQHQ